MKTIRVFVMLMLVAMMAVGCAKEQAKEETKPSTLPATTTPANTTPTATTPNTSTTPAFTDAKPAPGFGGQWEDNVHEAEMPQALRDWAAAQKDSQTPAHKVLTVGDTTYIAASGGIQKGAGHTIGIKKVDLPQPGGKPVVTLDLTVVPPAPNPSSAMNTPVRYFRITPQLVGNVVVNFS